MNRKAIQLLQDFADAGVDTNIIIPHSSPIPLRTGKVAFTDETMKIEIAGLPCEVKSEDGQTARIYVIRDGKREGPYYLKPSEVV